MTIFIAFFIPILLFTAQSFACTRILINDHDAGVFVGRNMDWNEEMDTNLIFYPRNTVRYPQEHSAPNLISWTSKYANIVATGYEDFSTDGLNEEGLAAHILWFEDSDFGAIDPTKPGLSLTQWTQYYLDQFKTVDEAVQFTKTDPFQIVPFYHPLTQQWGKLHLVLDDASGDSAIFEYVNGVLQIHHDRSIIVAANEPAYENHLLNLLEYQVFGGNKTLPGELDSLDRFVRATYFAGILAKTGSSKTALAGVLSILNNVAHPYTPEYRTIWRTAADLSQKIYYFQSIENQKLIVVKISDYNPDHPTTIKLGVVGE